MSYLEVNGARLYYEDTGGGGEPIVFSHGLLWNVRMYEAQVAALQGAGFRCIAYDHRGQGRSTVPGGDSIDLDTLYEDAVALIGRLGVGPCHFVGLSMGGFVGMRLAARRPDLVRSLVLLNTSADAESAESLLRYKLLNTAVRWVGAWAVSGQVMKVMFGDTFLSDPTRAAEREERRRQLGSNRRDVWRAISGVIYRRGVAEELPRITAPTLVLSGEEDRTTAPSKSERIHAAIAGSRLVRLARCGHMSTLEQPAQVNTALSQFLDEVSATRRTG